MTWHGNEGEKHDLLKEELLICDNIDIDSLRSLSSDKAIASSKAGSKTMRSSGSSFNLQSSLFLKVIQQTVEMPVTNIFCANTNKIQVNVISYSLGYIRKRLDRMTCNEGVLVD
jgi:hypothetical protein